jgi:ZIP family zinc transporter
MPMNLVLIGSIASFLAGLGSGVGALMVFCIRRVSDRFLDASLGFAAGVMLAATCFCLFIPAIEAGGIWRTVLGILCGTGLFVFIEHLTPHMERIVGLGPSMKKRKVWLFVLAIALHNFPEGIAVGVGYGRGDIRAGSILATGIWLQNIPEGLAVALPLLREKLTRAKAFWIALLTGMIEPVGGILGITVTSMAQSILPYGLAFAGGAMLLVISEGVIPEAHSRGHHREATFGVIFGFIVMMVLEDVFS